MKVAQLHPVPILSAISPLRSVKLFADDRNRSQQLSSALPRSYPPSSLWQHAAQLMKQVWGRITTSSCTAEEQTHGHNRAVQNCAKFYLVLSGDDSGCMTLLQVTHERSHGSKNLPKFRHVECALPKSRTRICCACQ